MNKSPEIERFYTSNAWRKCRAAFVKYRGEMCEECWKRGVVETGSKDRPLEVHHIIPLTDKNINNPGVTFNWNNLQLLCKDCHDAKKQKQAKRWKVDANGKVMI